MTHKIPLCLKCDVQINCWLPRKISTGWNIPESLSTILPVLFMCSQTTDLDVKFDCLPLSPADHSALYTNVAVCLAATLTLLALAAALLFFKVDLVLASREVMRHFSKCKYFIRRICAFLWIIRLDTAKISLVLYCSISSLV